MAQLIDLLRLADSVLDTADIDERLNYLEAYTEAFDLWFQHSGGEDPTRLAELEERHVRILELAESLRDSTNTELRAHHKRGKGILAYADTLPKSVSRSKPRQG